MQLLPNGIIYNNIFSSGVLQMPRYNRAARVRDENAGDGSAGDEYLKLAHLEDKRDPK
jgi:hypothetical protein